MGGLFKNIKEFCYLYFIDLDKIFKRFLMGFLV